MLSVISMDGVGNSALHEDACPSRCNSGPGLISAADEKGVKSWVESTIFARRHRLRRAGLSSRSTRSWRRTTAWLAAPWKSMTAQSALCHRPTACQSMTSTWHAPTSSLGSARYGILPFQTSPGGTADLLKMRNNYCTRLVSTL